VSPERPGHLAAPTSPAASETPTGASAGPGLSVRRRGSSHLISDVAAVVVPVVAFLVAVHLVANELLLLNMLLYVALAQGINLIYGFTGYLPFGYVAFFGAGAYGASLSVLYLHVPAAVAVLLGGLAATVLGGLLTPLLRLSGAYFAIASLAAAEAVYEIISNPSLTSITKGPYGINLVAIYNAGASYDAAVALLGATMAGIVMLRRSHFGLALRATAADPVAAQMAGVPVVRERSFAWLLAAAVAGFAGAIFAWAISTFYPTAVFDLSVSVFAIVFALFGGVGTVWGPLVGAVVLYGIYNAVGLSDPQYFELTYGLLIVALVLFLPGGLGSLGRAWRRRVSRREPR
jgi:branched-chain amino acid transport system permease protein